MTKEQREKLKRWKSEANEAKSALIYLEGRIRTVSPRQADQLWQVIGRLEAWQNR